MQKKIAKTDGKDVLVKAMIMCHSCSIVGHRFEMNIHFHEIRMMNVLVKKEGEKKHKELSNRCSAKGIVIRTIGFDYHSRRKLS